MIVRKKRYTAVYSEWDLDEVPNESAGSNQDRHDGDGDAHRHDKHRGEEDNGVGVEISHALHGHAIGRCRWMTRGHPSTSTYIYIRSVLCLKMLFSCVFVQKRVFVQNVFFVENYIFYNTFNWKKIKKNEKIMCNNVKLLRQMLLGRLSLLSWLWCP